MIPKLEEINQRENRLIRSFYGMPPEANNELNAMQREKIAAVYENNGSAYTGKINYHRSERDELSAATVFSEYTGQLIYNFGADFIIPEADDALAKLIMDWNNRGNKVPTRLFKQIYSRIESLGGANLLWS